MMKKRMNIWLHSAEEVREFANLAMHMDGDVKLSSGRYCIDAKSIISIWVLDLTAPLLLEIADWKEEYTEKLEPYLFS